MLGYLFQDSLAASALTLSFYNDYVQNSWKFFTHSFMTVNFLILVFGLIFSYFYYYKKSLKFKVPLFIKNTLKQEYGFNNLSSTFVPKIQNTIAKYLWKNVDVSMIDNGLINSTSNFLSLLSNRLKRLQTGYIYHYSLIIISALIFLLILMRITY